MLLHKQNQRRIRLDVIRCSTKHGISILVGVPETCEKSRLRMLCFRQLVYGLCRINQSNIRFERTPLQNLWRASVRRVTRTCPFTTTVRSWSIGCAAWVVQTTVVVDGKLHAAAVWLECLPWSVSNHRATRDTHWSRAIVELAAMEWNPAATSAYLLYGRCQAYLPTKQLYATIL